ncbi:uncharacterized protein im:7136021 [Boleophthalmus pectinirostris]|uniref:uncharacterized protein im:7136021 n=1 Tax=Boleophthalmus pectinirostris TaxID=150288 RepID=UPI00242A9519|nr:uncharacterized protein im:7136021 [Boleophthalmus pectinirostris]
MEELPPEVVVHILSFLNTADKHSVRCCCRSLQLLSDHPALWRQYTVFLTDLRRYTYGFWDTLSRRRITRVAVRHLRRKEWRRLITFLPSLTAIVFVDGGRLYREKYLVNLSRFPDLRDLGVRNATWEERMLSWSLADQLRERLTHLSVCNVRLPWPVEFISAASRLINLRSLLFHQHAEGLGGATIRPVPCLAFHKLLQNLTHLQYLSWGMKGEPPEPLEEDYFCPPDPQLTDEDEWRYGGPALTSLELVDYPEAILPESALEHLSSLRSLTVRYKSIHQGLECRLKHWLSPLTQLQDLTIAGGHAISNYACSIPPTVTRLTLRLSLTLKDMEIIAPRVPGLTHLDIEQNRSSGSLCRRIPALFPHLRSLRLRFLRREPEKDLLNLHRLQHLERLDLFVHRCCLNGKYWPTPFVKTLIEQLQELTQNRVKVCTQRPPRDMLRDCDCVYEDH